MPPNRYVCWQGPQQARAWLGIYFPEKEDFLAVPPCEVNQDVLKKGKLQHPPSLAPLCPRSQPGEFTSTLQKIAERVLWCYCQVWHIESKFLPCIHSNPSQINPRTVEAAKIASLAILHHWRASSFRTTFSVDNSRHNRAWQGSGQK